MAGRNILDTNIIAVDMEPGKQQFIYILPVLETGVATLSNCFFSGSIFFRGFISG